MIPLNILIRRRMGSSKISTLKKYIWDKTIICIPKDMISSIFNSLKKGI
jgi:hypothetical protein